MPDRSADPALLTTQMRGSNRLESVDVLRGLIMVVMALDHVSLMVGRFHSAEMWAGAWTRYTSELAFLTRFASHFCAPGFFFLMGAGVSLLADARSRQGWPASQVTRFVLTRGALLILVSTLLEVPAFLVAILSGPPDPASNPDYAVPGLTEPRWVLSVLFTLGASLVISSVFLRARAWVWAAMAAAALLVTAATTPGPEHFDTPYGFWRTVLMLSRWSHGVWSQYPVGPAQLQEKRATGLLGPELGLEFGLISRVLRHEPEHYILGSPESSG